MKEDWRMPYVMSVVRTYEKERQRIKQYRKASYDRNDMIAHVFIKVTEFIKENPVASNAAIHLFGLTEARKWVKRWKYNLTPQGKERAYVPAINCKDERDTESLLSLWCSTRKQRTGMTILSRLTGYLHLVEGYPVGEIAEIFGRTVNAVNASLYVLRKRKTMVLKKDDVVMIVTDNKLFHEMLAWVKEPTEFGAIVEVESHNYPHRTRWELRCLHSEMIYIGSVANRPNAPQIPDKADGSKHIVAHAQAVHRGRVVYTSVEPVTRDPQFTGDECNACGKMMMVRAGTCLTCLNCGTSSGC